VELSGDVGCCNLLVRAVQLPRDVIGRQSAPSPDVIGRSASRDVAGRDAIGCESAASSCWSYVAHELRSVDEIDGSLMHTILRHRSHTHTHTHTHVSVCCTATRQLSCALLSDRFEVIKCISGSFFLCLSVRVFQVDISQQRVIGSTSGLVVG